MTKYIKGVISLVTLMKIRSVSEWEVSGIGKKIRAARLADDRTVGELAAAAGISRDYWYRLEKESLQGAVSLETLQAVERVLGVKLL